LILPPLSFPNYTVTAISFLRSRPFQLSTPTSSPSFLSIPLHSPPSPPNSSTTARSPILQEHKLKLQFELPFGEARMVICKQFGQHLHAKSILKTGNSTQFSSKCPFECIEYDRFVAVERIRKTAAVSKKKKNERSLRDPSLKCMLPYLASAMNDDAVSACSVLRVALLVGIRGARIRVCVSTSGSTAIKLDAISRASDAVSFA
jgi:hypothetical protein